MRNRIDHVVVGAMALEPGTDAMKEKLGVVVPAGSKHTAMSTHNCVMQSGNESFFELIAVDPDAPNPGRTRWFSLDDPDTAGRLAERPRALCWVVNTDDLEGVVASSPVFLGEVVDFQRGDRTWRLTVPTDGHLPEGGLLPAFIEWSPGPHPSTGHTDLGVRLSAVRISTPDPERMRSVFSTLQIDHLAEILEGPAGLAFEFDSPNGTVLID